MTNRSKLSRRSFILRSILAAGYTLMGRDSAWALPQARRKRPHVVFVLTDQWRAQDTGYAGNPVVKTPCLDRLSKESLVFTSAVSCMPVSTPYRASLLTGQYALSHGLFLNDIQLGNRVKTIGKCYKEAGYDTAYIGKWHLNGHGRSSYIKPEHRQGFDYFKVLECTHDYNQSKYYDRNDPGIKKWEGYDAFAQTEDAIDYIERHAKSDRPFFLVLSWGPPHNPYETAPEPYKAMYANTEIPLRPNVPLSMRKQALRDIRGYYAHCSALDECVGRLESSLRRLKIDQETVFVFTSDHGDMLYSQGLQRKQKPYDESIRVPLLLRYPALFGRKGRWVDTLLNTPDIMPTLLSLCGLPIPETVEGTDLVPILTRKKRDSIEAALIECITPFGEWDRSRGGKEYRGIRTKRYTYTRDLNGPWLLFDNDADPYQLTNLAGNAAYREVEKQLDTLLNKMLEERKDRFLPGKEYIKQWNHPVNARGTVEFEK